MVLSLAQTSGGLPNVDPANPLPTTPLPPPRSERSEGEWLEAARGLVLSDRADGLADLFEQSGADRYLEEHGRDLLRLALFHERSVTGPVPQLLIERGVERDLWIAAYLGEPEHVERLLEENPKAVNERIDGAGYPLHAAAGSGNAEVVQMLLDAGAEVNARSQRNNTALHVAAGRGHSEVVALLLAHGADVNAESRHGIRPLTHAGNADVALLLVDAGADPLFVQRNGNSAVAAAAASGNVDVFAYLLSLDLDIPEPMWEEAMREAIAGGTETRKEIVEAMIDAGVDVDRGLYYAAGYGDLWTADRFLEEGADVNGRFGQTTVLHAAVASPLARPRLIERLLEEGASVSVRNDAGLTPLEIAISDRNRELVRLLKAHAEP